MPRISSFYGIVIAMYFNDHSPPHFHAIYETWEAQVSIASGELIEGSLPRRARRLVRDWARSHRAELERNWIRARVGEKLPIIEALP